MRELGFYQGRILVGNFKNDLNGFEARETFRFIKKISKTYKLPGVNVVPLDKLKENKAREEWLRGKNKVSSIVLGNQDHLELYFPDNKDSDLDFPLNLNFPFNKRISKIKLAGYQQYFVLPGAPEKIILPKNPLSVSAHFISWISAFFHPEISKNTLSRIDVVNEAARIKGPWKSHLPKVLARYLFSLEEFLTLDHLASPVGIRLAKERLERALFGLEQSPHPELYASTLTLIAMCEISKLGDSRSFQSGKQTLEKIVNNQEIPINLKLPAIYNLGVLTTEMN